MKHDRAVVIGGSIAGLMAARALANHYAQVIVLEKDSLEDEDAPRKGVPQANHVHVLLTSGVEALEHYFPGIVAEMVEGGVERVAWSEEIRWYQGGSWKTRVPCGIDFYPQARVRLEGRIRARLRQRSGVEIRAGAAVQQLVFDATRGAVTGVRVTQGGQSADIAADLVFDASGRGSRVLKWLEELGYPAPPSESLRIDLAYFSRVYQKTAEARDWKGLACHPLPNLPRGGIILPIDDQRWLVTLFGYAGDYPASADSDAFMRFAKNLPIPDVHDTLSRATPLSDVMKYDYPQQLRQRYDKVARFPDGLLLAGDAVCSLDPVFGQGMTVACKEARALDAILAALPADAEPRRLRAKFFRACQQIIEVPWLITQSEALRFPQLSGRRTPIIRVLQWYTDHVFALSASSAEVYRSFLEVMHLTAGPVALFRPAVLRRVLGRALRRRPA